jgi:hypothetical protein
MRRASARSFAWAQRAEIDTRCWQRLPFVGFEQTGGASVAVNKVLDATNKLVTLLESVDKADRAKVIQAAFVLLGEEVPVTAAPVIGAAPAGAIRQGTPIQRTGATSEKEFFDAKQPANKIEELAVAARYREEVLDAAGSTKEDLKATVKAARRNFDDSNYRRDINNAKVKGLFNRGNGEEAVLSHYGQKYVDALPDRDAAKAVRRPKGAGARKVAKRPAKKKTAK